MEFGGGDDFSEFFHIDWFNVDDIYCQCCLVRIILND
jgi:hypothetical protein